MTENIFETIARLSYNELAELYTSLDRAYKNWLLAELRRIEKYETTNSKDN